MGAARKQAMPDQDHAAVAERVVGVVQPHRERAGVAGCAIMARNPSAKADVSRTLLCKAPKILPSDKRIGIARNRGPHLAPDLFDVIATQEGRAPPLNQSDTHRADPGNLPLHYCPLRHINQRVKRPGDHDLALLQPTAMRTKVLCKGGKGFQS